MTAAITAAIKGKPIIDKSSADEVLLTPK